MNRAERRRAGAEKDPVYTLRRSDIDRIKQEAAKQAAEHVLALTLGLPVMVLHDKWGFGAQRCERFVDQLADLYQSYVEGYISLDDIRDTLREETGCEIRL